MDSSASPTNAVALDPVALAPRDPALLRWLRFVWLNRPRRILLALAAVWVLNLFDLGFTIAESEHLHFVEMNPIAKQLMSGPPTLLIAYKAALVLAGTLILLWVRQHRVAEWGAWFLLAAYFYVAVRWFVYYECLYTDDMQPEQSLLAELL